MKRNLHRALVLPLILLMLTALQQCSYSQSSPPEKKKNNMDSTKKNNPAYSRTDSTKVNLTDEEWKKILPSEVYHIARQKGTERPWSSKFEHSKEIGTYYCAVCGNPLFKSDTKFESGCGWPSFYEPVTKGSIIYQPDNTHGMSRTEVLCGRCKSHLGHVFDDGPPPTGLRYCINGVVLDFEKAKEAEKKYKEGQEEE
ncbi:peptide-methionine (R)-S-oxide reductase MsrB [Pseudobacter ginsenosidimutans]|uniref:Peptide methionine sulfoxide reductase MsrB n=1 Tax=Pseudobacter ginsenosidimutans TaxID=661488 RepID=A0A4Q7MS27_9BACT|nr:peptide-methionine (R)-S-oxide reductase MsrB [Pseudobacter ginsenosidimutans]RZS71586.1 peptide-methionine (R)-S-oxide reductase [Pseudobacter ginsenosidimutans]